MPFLPWLFAIATRVRIDHLRKHRALPIADEALAHLQDQQALGNTDATSAEVALEEVLRLLPPQQRRVLEMRFSEGLFFESIAEETGITPVSARKRVSRALQALKQRWRGEGEGR